MLKSTKVYFAALSVASALALASQPSFAQMEAMDDPSDMGEMDIVINLPDGPGGFDGPELMGPPEGGAAIALSMPLPIPGDVVGAMRGGFRGRGGPGGPGGGPCPVGGRGFGDCPLFMLDGENAVTDEQYEKLYDLKNKAMDQIGPKMLELMQAKRHLKDTLTSENIDEKAAKKLQNQITSAKSDIETIKLDGKLQAMQILTAAQRKELRKAMVQGPKRPPGGGMHHMMRKYMEKRESSK